MCVQVSAEARGGRSSWNWTGVLRELYMLLLQESSLQPGSISFYQEKDLVVMIIQICISPRIVSKQQGTETDFEIELLR